MEANNIAAMREALVGLAQAVREFMATKGANFYPDVAIALEAANAALSAPPRVCDVNTLESLSDFVEKTILTSDLLKDTNEIVKSIVIISVRTALTVAYEPAKRE